MIAAGGIEELLFNLVEALRVPVLVAALLAALFMLFDLGTFLVELLAGAARRAASRSSTRRTPRGRRSSGATHGR